MECPQCGFRQPESNECMQCQAPMGDMADQGNILFDGNSSGEQTAPEPASSATAVAPSPLDVPLGPPDDMGVDAPAGTAMEIPDDMDMSVPIEPPPVPPSPAAPPLPKPSAPSAPTPKMTDLPPPSGSAGTGVTSKPPPPPPPPPAATPPVAKAGSTASVPHVPAVSGSAPSVMLVTTSDVPGKQIASVQGMVSAQAMMHVGVELVEKLASNPAGAAVDQATRTAEVGLIGAAVAKGANAVVGITCDWKPAENGALLLTMSGTAVTVS